MHAVLLFSLRNLATGFQLILFIICVVHTHAQTQLYREHEFYRTHLKLLQVPSDIPTEVEEVHLEQNNIRNLTRGLFAHLTGCVTLDLSNNIINSLENGALIGLSNLCRIDLSHNRLTHLYDSMWDGLQSLIGLYLYRNHIHTILPGCFWTLKYLELLSLTENQLTEIRGELWHGLYSLDALDLGANPLQTIPKNGFANLPCITRISLYCTGIRTLKMDIFNLQDFPQSDGHPRRVKLVLNGNPLQCDERLCWLKQGEKDGWVSWFVAHYVGKPYMGIHSPQCINFLNTVWDDIPLDCPTNSSTILAMIIIGSVLGRFSIACILFFIIYKQCTKNKKNCEKSNPSDVGPEKEIEKNWQSVIEFPIPLPVSGSDNDGYTSHTAIYESFGDSTKL